MRRKHAVFGSRIVVLAWLGAALAFSCASSEESGIFEDKDGGAGKAGSAGKGGAGGGGGGLGGTSGQGGSGGTSATGGTGGVGGSTDGGTCNAAFCPASGPGAPCCVTPNGPCGYDNGMGCMSDPGTGGATGVGGSSGVGGFGGVGGTGATAGAGGLGGTAGSGGSSGGDASPDVSTDGGPSDASMD